MKTTNQLFTENNKKLLDIIMSKEEGVIYCNSVIDPNDPIFECEHKHLRSEKDENEEFLFI